MTVVHTISTILKNLEVNKIITAATLVAMSNGVGDVIAVIAASNSHDSIFYQIGTIYGAALIGACLAIPLLIYKNKNSLKLPWKSIEFVKSNCVGAFEPHLREWAFDNKWNPKIHFNLGSDKHAGPVRRSYSHNNFNANQRTAG